MLYWFETFFFKYRIVLYIVISLQDLRTRKKNYFVLLIFNFALHFYFCFRFLFFFFFFSVSLTLWEYFLYRFFALFLFLFHFFYLSFYSTVYVCSVWMFIPYVGMYVYAKEIIPVYQSLKGVPLNKETDFLTVNKIKNKTKWNKDCLSLFKFFIWYWDCSKWKSVSK